MRSRAGREQRRQRTLRTRTWNSAKKRRPERGHELSGNVYMPATEPVASSTTGMPVVGLRERTEHQTLQSVPGVVSSSIWLRLSTRLVPTFPLEFSRRKTGGCIADKEPNNIAFTVSAFLTVVQTTESDSRAEREGEVRLEYINPNELCLLRGLYADGVSNSGKYRQRRLEHGEVAKSAWLSRFLHQPNEAR